MNCALHSTHLYQSYKYLRDLSWIQLLNSYFDLLPQAPEEPDPYEDVFVADQLSSACEQSSGLLIWLTQPGWNDYNEDCLHLSIYAPAVSSCVIYFKCLISIIIPS